MGRYLVNFKLLWILVGILKQWKVRNHQMDKYLPLINGWNKKAPKKPKKRWIYF